METRAKEEGGREGGKININELKIRSDKEWQRGELPVKQTDGVPLLLGPP